MDSIVTEFDRKSELLLEAQINTVVQLKQPNPEGQAHPIAHHMNIRLLPEERADLVATIIEEWNAHSGTAPECARTAH
ncbi:hypothetical protein Aduo_005822 [Ancylostoma duodenale]